MVNRKAISVAVIMNAPSSPVPIPSLPEETYTLDLFGNPVDEKPFLEKTVVYVVHRGDATGLKSLLQRWSRRVAGSK